MRFDKIRTFGWSLALSTLAICSVAACTPKIGSEGWCNELAETPKIDWSMRDAADYTKYCVLNQDPDE